MVYSQGPPPTLVGDGILCILIFKDGKINLHVGSSLPMLSAMLKMLGAF